MSLSQRQCNIGFAFNVLGSNWQGDITMGRQSMMLLFRSQIAAVEAEIRAKNAEIASLQAAQEAAEAKIQELHHHKEKLEEQHDKSDDEPGRD
jgi:hypothetical protein